MTEANPKPAERRTEKTIAIAAPVETVWTALTDPEELTRWFPLEASVKPGAGGSIRLSWGPNCEGEAAIEIWEPNRRLRWVESGTGRPIAVEFTLEARGGKTIVRLVNSGFAAEGADWENEYYDSTNFGWGFMLASLRHYLERHAGQPRRVAWPRLKVAVSRQAAYERLLGAHGLFAGGNLGGRRHGERYSLRAATGETLAGRVEFIVPPRGFCITVEELNDALFWLTIEGLSDGPEVQIWLSAYGLTPPQVDGFRDRWAAQLDRIFA